VTNNSGKHLSPDSSPANNILRPLTCSKPRIIERVWKHSFNILAGNESRAANLRQ
jgi:hypothetical protein